jgi:hypothetical protein
VPWTASYFNNENKRFKDIWLAASTCDLCGLDAILFKHACDQCPEPKMDDDGHGGEGDEDILEPVRMMGEEGRAEGDEGVGGDHGVIVHVVACVREEGARSGSSEHIEASRMKRTYVNDADVVMGSEKEG